jgi:ubiquitin-protein ligase
MSVREKRLRNDFQALSDLVNNSAGSLAIISTSGNPPYEYVIEYRCQGIEKLQGDNPVFRNRHQVNISLGNNYPREQPSAQFLTPIFHPNVYSHNEVCLGFKWTMAETLTELVRRIGKIIQYSPDVLNLNSPANGTAKTWAASNMHRFPVDTKTFKVDMSWTDM